MEYYIIIDGEQVGPFDIDSLISAGITPETPVWREGLDNWVPASSLAELSGILNTEEPQTNESAETCYGFYYAMVDGHRIGPLPVSELIATGCIRPDTLVWCEGMPKWLRAADVAAFRELVPETAVPPAFDANRFGNSSYGMPRYSGSRWMGWAIVAVAVNFITLWFVKFSIAGLVLGILGIYYSNESKKRYAIGMDTAASQSESNAKIMTIISLVIAGISLFLSIFVILTITSILEHSFSLLEEHRSILEEYRKVL